MIYDVDWTKSMQQTFSFYKVDPSTWKDESPITTVTSCDITRDLSDETLGSASISADDISGEFYMRTYLDVTQNGRFYHIPIGTHLIQSIITSFDGKQDRLSIVAYTPLIELKEKKTLVGFFFDYGDNIVESTIQQAKSRCRAPFIQSYISDITVKDQNGFVAEVDEEWLAFLTSFLKNAESRFGLTELGEVMIEKDVSADKTQPIWEYNDDDDSILYPEISSDKDLYGIPNVVELLISKPDRDGMLIRAVNDNPNSPISTISRGREIVYRASDPNIYGYDTKEKLQEYAEDLLDKLSSIDYQISYKHGFCPVKIGDCVLINYRRSGLTNIRAKVISQTIHCESGCSVDETASYTVNLRR